MDIVWTILVGFVVGLIARAVKPGDDHMGFIMTTVIGVGGALLAQLAGERLGWYARGEPASFVASVGGAIVLLFGYALLRPRR